MQLISRTSEYALRAVLWLIQDPERQQTTREIAEGTHTPPGYISKVLQLLAKSGIVQGQRGLGGGFQFSGDLEQITVLDVINAVDPLQYIHSCPLGLKEHATKLCPLHAGMNETTRQMEENFAATRLAALLNTGSSSVPLGIKLSQKKCNRRPGHPQR